MHIRIIGILVQPRKKKGKVELWPGVAWQLMRH